MATVTVELPEDLLEVLGGTPENAGREICLAAAMHWCGRGEMATGRAARLAGMSYAAFLEAAARRRVALFDYNNEDIAQELARPLPDGVDIEAIKRDLSRAQSARR